MALDREPFPCWRNTKELNLLIVVRLSKYHKEKPYSMNVNGQEFKVDYVPGDSNSSLFGGNSNWRGVSCPLYPLFFFRLLKSSAFSLFGSVSISFLLNLS